MYLEQISNILLINGGFLGNPGLYSGEMGLVLFFSRYSRLSQKELYSEYSFDLIEKIQNNIHQETPIDYKQGLTGIGSSFEYLVQNGFLEADTDELLEEFDDRIFSFGRMTHLSIDELIGIGFYAIWRMAGGSVQADVILKKVLPKLVYFINKRRKNNDFEDRTVAFIKDLIETQNLGMLSDILISIRSCRNRYPYGLEINTYNRYLKQFSKNELSLHNAIDLSLQNGLAGFGMALMTEYDCDDSWISLIPKDLISY